MKAKRLTALALAALMAASTTSVALAIRVDDDLVFADDGYYKYNSDTNRIESVDRRDDYQPGDDVYLRLDSSVSLPKEQTYNVYAEWPIGESWVKDVEIVYRKGDVTTSTSTKNYYSITGVGTLSGWNVNSTETTKSESDLKAELRQDEWFTNAVSKYVSDHYPTKSGYQSADGTFKEQVSDFNISENQKNGFFYKDHFYTSADEAGLKAMTSGAETFRTSTLYFASLEDVFTHFSFTNYTKLPDSRSVYVKADISSLNYGEASINGGGEYTQTAETAGLTDFITVEYSNQLYWVKKANIVEFINSKVSANLVDNTSGSEEYYFDESSVSNLGYTLVLRTDVTPKETTVYTYNGVDYETEEEAKTAAKIEPYNGPVDISTGKTISKENAEAAATTVVNADFDKSVKYESKTVTNTQPQYEYWVKISTKDSTTTKDIDVVGTIYVGEGTSKTSVKKNGDKFSADFTLTNSEPTNSDYDEATDYVSIEPGTRAVVSFADDASDEFEVEFGDDAYFVFNARGQGKLNLAYNTKYNRDFAYDYDDANIDFINFEGEPTTNRTGTLYIYADEDSYIYEVTSKGAKKINGAYYDDDEEAWVIRTRNLTSYAISDKKLKTVDQMNNGSSSSSSNKPGSNSGSGSNNGKPNPDTGR